MGDYIKINRRILEWEWYQDINTCRMFIHMLLKANWKDGKFRGTDIPRGSFVSSLNVLSDETQLTIREVRTAISHLKATGEVTSKSHGKYTVFTVKKYDMYQASDTQNDMQATRERHANDMQTTTIEEGKKGRREEDNINTYCPVAISFVLNDGSMYDVTENDVVMYQQLYPGIDVMQELRKIVGWCDGNPKNRKTRTGAKRFLNGWMSRAQDDSAKNRPRESSASKNRFNNFEQRTYNFNDLERRLLDTNGGENG